MCDTIIEKYVSDEKYDIPEMAISNGVDAVIYRVEQETAIIIYNGTRLTEEELLKRIQIFNSKIVSSELNSVNYTVKEQHIETVNSGAKQEINGEIIYFLTSSRLTPDLGASRILNISTIFVLFGSVVIAIILSFVFSNSISSPLQNMCASAKNLNSKNFEVNFNGTGYTEVEQLSSTLNFAVDELKKTDELRNEVVSNVSHELRTPLTMIKSYAELIKDINGNNPVKREENLNVILQEAERLETLLNDMLDFSKLKSGTTLYNFTEFNLYSLLQKLFETYSTKYNAEGYTFKFNSPKNLKITADYNRIEQVVVNLLNNAINYSKTNKEISITVSKLSTNYYRLAIKDNGIGISEANIKHIFDRHFRATNAQRTTVGSGIGLSIVKQILDDHKYQYGVISKVNKGSTFYFDFKTNN